MLVKIVDGSYPVMEIDLNSFHKDTVSFGRNLDNDIVLKSDFVSRVHGCFYRDNGSWYIQDLDSSYGIYVGNQKVKSSPISKGTVIRITPNSSKNVFVEMKISEAQKSVASQDVYPSRNSTPASSNSASVYSDSAPAPSNSNSKQVDTTKTSGLAVASMVCGIISLLSVCCNNWLSILLAILGLIFGIVGVRSGKRGKGMGIAGIVCSSITIVGVIIIIAFVGASDFLIREMINEMLRSGF